MNQDSKLWMFLFLAPSLIQFLIFLYSSSVEKKEFNRRMRELEK